ncbi:molybdopterin-guanine dinucleotide biosynthesis protein B [Paenibacillus sp. TSA_86.1]|uniref:molybdopterin-guanine dinucleotide biosynthesis protein B n=1 Tax=Paenibacillus sp. TSA_86.1 TaxID=3415649 RepID=UPI004046431D
MNKTSAAGPKIIQVVGYKNTGKTTMTATFIAGLTAKGLKVAAIKHDGHDHFEMDQKGTDSYQFGKAGAEAVVVISQKRTAIIKQHHTRLDEMLSQFPDYDWIVIEGFKDAPYPKLVMVREADDLTLVRKLEHVVGIVFWLPELMKEALEKETDREETDREETGTVLELETRLEAEAGIRGNGNRYDERHVREIAENWSVEIDKVQDIKGRSIANFLFSEREVIVDAVLQLNLTDYRDEK